jgi:hypothetical protein
MEIGHLLKAATSVAVRLGSNLAANNGLGRTPYSAVDKT